MLIMHNLMKHFGSYISSIDIKSILELQLNEENFGTHEYENAVTSQDNTAFVAEVKRLREHYQLP